MPTTSFMPKGYVFGRRCYIGSANVSESSKKLVEACIETTDTTTIAQAREFVKGLTGDLLTNEYVQSLIPLYPADGERLFGAKREKSSKSNAPMPSRMRVWVISVYDGEWGAKVQEEHKKAVKVAQNKMSDCSNNKLHSIHSDLKPSYQEGDWLIERFGSSRNKYGFGVPARVITVHPVPQKAGYIIYCERPKGQQPKTAAAAKKCLVSRLTKSCIKANMTTFFERIRWRRRLCECGSHFAPIDNRAHRRNVSLMKSRLTNLVRKLA